MFHESVILKKWKILEMLIRDPLLFQTFGNRSFSFQFFEIANENSIFWVQKLHLRKLQKCKILAIRARCCDFSKFFRPCRGPLATRSRALLVGM